MCTDNVRRHVRRRSRRQSAVRHRIVQVIIIIIIKKTRFRLKISRFIRRVRARWKKENNHDEIKRFHTARLSVQRDENWFETTDGCVGRTVRRIQSATGHRSGGRPRRFQRVHQTEDQICGRSRRGSVARTISQDHRSVRGNVFRGFLVIGRLHSCTYP